LTADMAEQPVVGKITASYPKEAIVVIHGMGEQLPMDTVRGFAKAVWADDPEVTRNGEPEPNAIWSRPDARTGSLELRRLTTRPSTPSPSFPAGLRQDFYELYWADLSGGSTWAQVRNWVWMLLFRNPRTRVSCKVRPAWLTLWFVTLVVVTLLATAALAPDSWPWWLRVLLGATAAGLSWGAHSLVVPSFGRVVRYTRALPDNVAARQAIRERGLKLLSDLHGAGYERIIVVGHSLGSIVAYDMIAHFWANRSAARTVREDSEAFRCLRQLEEAGAKLAADSGDAGAREAYETARNRLRRELRLRPKPGRDEDDARWLITDFITVGSPLGHAEFLLARDREDLCDRIRARELGVSPPVREKHDRKQQEAAREAGLPVGDAGLVCYPVWSKSEWQLHHAAHFAVVRWTNIYDSAWLVLLGDPISAPARPVYGEGVKDIDLAILRGRARKFTHNNYWRDTPALKVLREALDLAAQRDL
jgi:hypothetical protein